MTSISQMNKLTNHFELKYQQDTKMQRKLWLKIVVYFLAKYCYFIFILSFINLRNIKSA